MLVVVVTLAEWFNVKFCSRLDLRQTPTTEAPAQTDGKALQCIIQGWTMIDPKDARLRSWYMLERQKKARPGYEGESHVWAALADWAEGGRRLSSRP